MGAERVVRWWCGRDAHASAALHNHDFGTCFASTFFSSLVVLIPLLCHALCSFSALRARGLPASVCTATARRVGTGAAVVAAACSPVFYLRDTNASGATAMVCFALAMVVCGVCVRKRKGLAVVSVAMLLESALLPALVQSVVREDGSSVDPLKPVFVLLYVAQLGVCGASVWLWRMKARLPSARLLAETRPNFAHPSLHTEPIGLKCVEDKAGLWSKLTYMWIWPLLNHGYKRGRLELVDMPPLSKQDHARPLADRFDLMWQQAVANHRDASGPLPSLLRILHRLEWRTFYLCALSLLVSTVAGFGVPLLLNDLLRFLDDKEKDESALHGYLLAIGMSVCGAVQSLTEHQFWIIGVRCGMHTQEALVAAVYRKIFRMAPSTRARYTEGTLMNLMSVDACRIGDGSLVPALHWGTWSSLLTIAVSLYFLYNLLSYAAFAGISVLAFSWPAASAVSRRIKSQTKRVQEFRDVRATALSQALSMIRLLKACVWEGWAVQRVDASRVPELQAQRRKQILSAMNSFVVVASQVVAPVISFVVFTTVMGRDLDAAVTFSALAWFNIIQRPLAFLPWALSTLMDTLVSMVRLRDFLMAPETDERRSAAFQPDSSYSPGDPRIAIRNASFRWEAVDDGDGSCGDADTPRESRPAPHHTLSGINLEIGDGELWVVVGAVGAGKTSLLSALVGAISCVEGSVDVRGTLAYVGQRPWIQNMSVRDNVLFGKSFEPLRYRSVLRACALEPDLKVLEGGDLAMIGEEGVNLSGGQRQRISLARAVYANADVVVLDDVLSAVDAHVGRHIFDKCLCSLLHNKTRVVATHQTAYLQHPHVTKIVVVSDGSIRAVGTYHELLACGDDHVISLLGCDNQQSGDDAESREGHDGEGGEEGEAEDQRNPDEERRAVGALDARMLRRYIGLFGHTPFLLLLATVFTTQPLVRVAATYWLSLWVKHTADNQHAPSARSGGEEGSGEEGSGEMDQYIAVYCALSLGLCVVQFVRMALLVHGALTASRVLHSRMLQRVLHAPCRFFDTVLTGQVMNRFVKDVSMIDEVIPGVLADLSYQLLMFVSVLVVVSAVVPLVLLVVAVLAVPYVWVSLRYVWPARDLRRLDSTSRSPIFSHFGETIRGAVVIRAMGAQQRFEQQNIRLIQHNVMCSWLNWVANQWVTVWLELIGYAVIVACSCLAVWAHEENNISPSLIGLALTYVVQLPFLLGWCLKQYARVEVEFVAVERVLEYTQLGMEDENLHVLRAVPNGWPTHGHVEFRNLQLQYDVSLPPVLKGVSCELPAGAKVAIVGRTGSGKSSLALSLLRFYRFSGTILIDGVDINTACLSEVRQAVCMMPQAAQLFGDTIRNAVGGSTDHNNSNRHSADEVWGALQRAGVKERVKAMKGGLDEPVTEGGENLSAGERQLLCLARTLLSARKVVVCDEATSSIDNETDEVVTKVLLGLDCTLLFICHRLRHLRKFDLVMVMDGGRVVELAPPGDLLADPHSLLHGLAQRAGL